MDINEYVEFVKKVADVIEEDGQRDLALEFLLVSSHSFPFDKDSIESTSEEDIQRAKKEIFDEVKNKAIKSETNCRLTIKYLFYAVCILLLLINSFLSYNAGNKKQDLSLNKTLIKKNESVKKELIAKIDSSKKELKAKIDSLEKGNKGQIKEIIQVDKKINGLALYLSNTEGYALFSMLQLIKNGEFDSAASVYNNYIPLHKSNDVDVLNKVVELCATHSYSELEKMTVPEKVNSKIWKMALHGKLESILRKIGLQPTYDNLAIAVQTKNENAVKLLLTYGLDINKIINGVTLLTTATRFNDSESVKLLLQYGADPDVELANGKKALDFAKDETIKELLLETKN